MKPWILGLTGGIGSGKSAAARCFAGLGVHQVDLDQIARQVVVPGTSALARIVQHFGQSILLPSGALDRPALRARIFEQPAERRWLENLLHPLIREEAARSLAEAASSYAILVSPLLVESGQHRQVRRVLLVDVPEALQVRRTLGRDGGDEARVRAIMATQASREERLRHAHDVLVNDRGLTELQQEVERLHRFYLALRGKQA